MTEPVTIPDPDPVPVPDPDPTPEPDPEPEHHEDMRPAFVDEIIGAINSLKDASPITPPQDDVLDKTPVKPPWTHRKMFGKRD
jgi:hypothetical protein